MLIKTKYITRYIIGKKLYLKNKQIHRKRYIIKQNKQLKIFKKINQTRYNKQFKNKTTVKYKTKPRSSNKTAEKIEKKFRKN